MTLQSDAESGIIVTRTMHSRRAAILIRRAGTLEAIGQRRTKGAVVIGLFVLITLLAMYVRGVGAQGILITAVGGMFLNSLMLSWAISAYDHARRLYKEATYHA